MAFQMNGVEGPAGLYRGGGNCRIDIEFALQGVAEGGSIGTEEIGDDVDVIRLTGQTVAALTTEPATNCREPPALVRRRLPEGSRM